MNTIAPHLAVATVLAARHLSYIRPSATVRMAAQAAGATIAVLALAFLVAIAWAARSLVALLAQFLQVAAAMTSVLFTMVIAVVVAVALLVHH